MKNDMSNFAETAFNDLVQAKRQFGEYSYHDKGASEVMDLDPLLEILRKMSPKEAGNALTELEQMDDTSVLVGDLIVSMDDWDIFFDCADNEELISRHY